MVSGPLNREEFLKQDTENINYTEKVKISTNLKLRISVYQKTP